MNIRLYSIAILISALPQFALADAAKISLNQGDFVAAEKVSAEGDTVLRVKLSKSGRAKFKKLSKESVDQEIRTQVGGVTSDFKLRVPIHGDSLEMGPYSAKDADVVVKAINKK